MLPRNLPLNNFIVDKLLMKHVIEKKERLWQDCLEGKLETINIANARKKHQKIRKLAGYYEMKREYDSDAGESRKEMLIQIEQGWEYLTSGSFNPYAITLTDVVNVGRIISKKVQQKHPNGFRNEAIHIGQRIYDGIGTDQIVDNMIYLVNKIDDPLKKALYLHLEINHIHPFIDGNGRTARCFEGRLLKEEGYPIPLISPQQKQKYNLLIENACQAADGMHNPKRILCATSFMLNNISKSLDVLRENGIDNYRKGTNNF
ncbi:MAG: Fic family protein [Nanobdellota archaeon]